MVICGEGRDVMRMGKAEGKQLVVVQLEMFVALVHRPLSLLGRLLMLHCLVDSALMERKKIRSHHSVEQFHLLVTLVILRK